jgi:hypothetical protein
MFELVRSGARPEPLRGLYRKPTASGSQATYTAPVNAGRPLPLTVRRRPAHGALVLVWGQPRRSFKYLFDELAPALKPAVTMGIGSAHGPCQRRPTGEPPHLAREICWLDRDRH